MPLELRVTQYGKTLTLSGSALLAAPASLFAAEEGGGAGLFSINLGLTIWTIVVFLVVLGILAKFGWGPLLGAIEAREKGIQDTLDGAAQAREEAERFLAEHRKQLAEARRHAQEIVAEGREAGQRLRGEIEEKARAEGQSMLERARREVEREKEAAIEALRRESVDLALAAASKLLRRRLDAESDRELVVDYLDQLNRPEGGIEA